MPETTSTAGYTGDETTPAAESMTDDQLVTYVKQELSESLGAGSDDDELTRNWEKALEYYLGKPRGDEISGRSQVISMDVADAVEQALAEVMPAFMSPDLVEFESTNEQDEDQAAVESDAMNYLVMEKCNGFITFLQACKDGMLQRNGTVKVYVCEKAEVTGDRYENISAFELEQALAPQEQDEQVEVVSQDLVQEAQYMTDPMTGATNVVTPDVFNIEVKRTRVKRQLKIDPVPPEEFRINGDHHNIFVQDARFVCHERPVSQSDLIAMGYDPDVINNLPTHGTDTDTEDRARSRDEVENDYHAAHRSGRMILVAEAYYQIDYDGDGIAERRKIVTAGGELLENEYHPYVPFSSGTPFILPHRFYGLSYYDKGKQVQDVKTAFLRKTIDNAEALINQRKVITAGEVNMDDVLSSRPGGVVREKTPGSFRVEQSQPLGDTGFKMMNYMDKVRREGMGSALDRGTSENQPVAAGTAHGMERWMTSQEQLSALQAKTFAATLIHGTYLLAHRVVREVMPGPMQFKVRGQFQQTDSRQWLPREGLTIHVGMSLSERQRRIQTLETTIQKQITAMESGADGVLTDYSGIYSALIDQLKAADVANPEQYWIDPSSDQARQMLQQKSEQAQQQLGMQQQQAQQMAQMTLLIEKMQNETKLIGDQLKFQVDSNEQLRKWVETELKYDTDIPGQGQE